MLELMVEMLTIGGIFKGGWDRYPLGSLPDGEWVPVLGGPALFI